MATKIFVTGSNGFLGQTLIEQVCAKTNTILIASSKGSNRCSLPLNYTYIDLDICDESNLDEAIKIYKPDFIINTAAISNVDACHTNKALCWKINVEAVEALVRIGEKYGIHLIHISTDFVFDGNNGPYLENDEPNPISVYGESKYEAEKIVEAASCKWTIIRTILVYGITRDKSRSNIILWAKSALETGQQISVVEDQWRTPTLVDDLANACLLVVEKKATGIFHVSGEDMMSVYELVMKVAKYWDLDASLVRPIPSERLNQEAKRPRRTGFLLNKAISVLGYQPHSFLDGVKKMDAKMKMYKVQP